MRERIQADIERKVQGQDITEAEPSAAEPAQIIDLMAALKASLGKGKAGSPGGAAPAADTEEPAARRGARSPSEPAAEAEARRKR